LPKSEEKKSSRLKELSAARAAEEKEKIKREKKGMIANVFFRRIVSSQNFISISKTHQSQKRFPSGRK